MCASSVTAVELLSVVEPESRRRLSDGRRRCSVDAGPCGGALGDLGRSGTSGLLSLVSPEDRDGVLMQAVEASPTPAASFWE